ncbi:M14 family metallopeptidase [Dyadobacter sp. CY345]|uniref:M14 family metallopeptidase n=1 Tax=Dyadobacter sp. CY345 TaxID=2909335 RepID=UPI001F1A8175|nr:M14 family metallopeptidase [Dyadobacter sp. CY345]MCF2443981.1 M14 family metallopeptidase [Dyadobacter sp. CY345]
MKNKIILFFCAMFMSGFAIAQSSYFFQNEEVKAGTKKHFLVPIVTGKDSTFIPVSVFNGVRNGETLGITAGVHGYEYAPIMGAQKLIRSINPQKLMGVVILVQLAGLDSFLGRSPYVSPVDKKNLNRSFPGSKNGSNTDKVANFITEQIISKSNYFLDMHSGDAPEDLMRYGAYYSNSSLPEISAKGKEMAYALGFDHVVVFNTDGKAYMKKAESSLYCTAEAFKRGIPSVDIECGRLGIVEQAAVDKVETSVLNLLDYLKFLPLSQPKTQTVKPSLISNRIYTSSKFDGIFYPAKKAGDQVTKGMKLGHITDYFGNILQTIYAEADGLLLLIITTPPINKGEDVTVIAKIDQDLSK